MKTMRWIVTTTILCILTIICVSCSEVAITGRSQLNLIPDSTMNSLALQEYNQFLKENKKSTDAANTAMVQRVGLKIADAVGRYCRSHGMTDRIAGFNWEFNLVESKDINAWAMPGGKVVVYTGILPITKDETGLAVVIGHEVAHVIARHGNERMSQGLLVELGGTALSEAMASKPAETQKLFMQAYGATTNIGFVLPYSRLQESEADRMGLIFMAMADYDPQAAVGFWQRMAAQPGNNQKPPQFLSTHPADDTRIAGIRSYLPEAMSYYRSQGQAVQPTQSQQQTGGWQSIIR